MIPQFSDIKEFSIQLKRDLVNDITHSIEFASRIVSKIEGIDGTAKFGTSVISAYVDYLSPFAKSFLKVDLVGVESFKNFKTMLSGLIEFDKFTNIFPRTYKWVKSNNSDRDTWTKALQLTFLCVVTVFDVYNFSCIVRGVKKAGDVAKLLKNTSFVAACSFGIFNDSKSIKSANVKKDLALKKVEKWREKEVKAGSKDELIKYYNKKLTNDLTEAKVKKLNENIENLNKEVGYQEIVKKVKCKQKLWDARLIHINNQIDLAEQNRCSQSAKIVSLALDISKIGLTILSLTSISAFGYVLPIASVVTVVFDATNFYLGWRGMKKYHFTEYNLNAHVDNIKKELKVDLNKEKPFKTADSTINI